MENAYEEVKIGDEMYKFELNVPVEGQLKEIRHDVGTNHSMVYTVGDKTFWGTTALDLLLSRVKEGDSVRITMVDENHLFPSGRTGKNFRVEVKK